MNLDKTLAIRTLYELCESLGRIPINFSDIHKIQPEEVTTQSKTTLLVLLNYYIQLHEKSMNLIPDAPYKVAAYSKVKDIVSNLPKTITYSMLSKNNIAGKSIMKRIKLLFPYIHILIPKTLKNTTCDFTYTQKIPVEQLVHKEHMCGKKFVEETDSGSDSELLNDTDDESVNSTWSKSSFQRESTNHKKNLQYTSLDFEHKQMKNLTEPQTVSFKKPYPTNEVLIDLKKVVTTLNDIENKSLELDVDIINKKELYSLSKVIIEMKSKYYKQLMSIMEELA